MGARVSPLLPSRISGCGTGSGVAVRVFALARCAARVDAPAIGGCGGCRAGWLRSRRPDHGALPGGLDCLFHPPVQRIPGRAVRRPASFGAVCRGRRGVESLGPKDGRFPRSKRASRRVARRGRRRRLHLEVRPRARPSPIGTTGRSGSTVSRAHGPHPDQPCASEHGFSHPSGNDRSHLNT